MMIETTLQRFITDVTIKWNTGQRMTLFMLLLSAELINLISWMTYIEFSSYAQQFVNVSLIKQVFPWLFVALTFLLFAAFLFDRFQDDAVFVERFQLLTMLVYSVCAAYVGYLVGMDNIISAIAICVGSVLIILFCDRRFALGFIGFNISLMFANMYAVHTGIYVPSGLPVGDVSNTFWFYSYIQLCAVKLVIMVLLVYNMLYVLRESYKNSKFLAEHDSLTGLPNRKKIMTYLESIIADGYDVGVMMIDLDYFKQINDNFGHSKGDEVLVNVAQMLQRSLRGSDMLGRYGGEEFMLVVPKVDLETSTVIAMRLHQLFRTLNIPVGKDKLLMPTASIGVVATDFVRELYDKPLTDIELQHLLFEMADASMYYAKSHGRNLLVTAKDLPPDSLSTKKQNHAKKEINLTIIDTSPIQLR